MLEAYTYDANGNRGGRTYADDDRMTGTHVYDAAGFLVSRGADTFTYTDRGQLKTATVGGVRRSTTSTTRPTGSPRASPAACARSSCTALRAARSASPRAASAASSRSTSTTDTGLLVALERGGARYYVGTDQVGTPRVITDASGAVVKTFATNAFGVRNKAAETGTFELPLGFAGGIEDPVTGLVRFGLRDYEPATGRFTAQGPDPARGRHEPVRVRRQRPGRPARPVRHGRGRRASTARRSRRPGSASSATSTSSSSGSRARTAATRSRPSPRSRPRTTSSSRTPTCSTRG